MVDSTKGFAEVNQWDSRLCI